MLARRGRPPHSAPVGHPDLIARREREIERHRTVYAVGARALKDGVLVRPDRCSRCGALHTFRHGKLGGGKRIQAHHADYSKPLKVTWLCVVCHRREHGGPRATQGVRRPRATTAPMVRKSRAEKIVRATYPRARIERLKPVTPGEPVYYLVRLECGSPVWVGCGDTPAKAWGDAVERLKLDVSHE